jgi:hypothetical protein
VKPGKDSYRAPTRGKNSRPEPWALLWQRWPLLGATIGTIFLLALGFLLVAAVRLDSLASIPCLCFIVFGVIYAWYMGISLSLLDRKIKRVQREKEKLDK